MECETSFSDLQSDLRDWRMGQMIPTLCDIGGKDRDLGMPKRLKTEEWENQPRCQHTLSYMAL